MVGSRFCTIADDRQQESNRQLFLTLRVSRAVDHLEQTPVRHLLEHTDSCLLTRIEQRTDGVQELYLIRMQVRIGFIEFTDGMQDFIVCAIRALNQRPELLHDFQSARTNLKPVFDVSFITDRTFVNCSGLVLTTL